ncbi:acyltransferase [Vallitalea sediminicola]
MKKFLLNFGLLRIICALSVLGIHVTARYINHEFSYIINQFFRYCVPIFIIMSGYFLHYSDTRDKLNSTLLDFYIKHLKKIIIPYVIWLAIYVIYNNRHHLNKLLTLDYVNIILTGYNHLYFLLIIIQLYIIYPLLKKLLKYRKGIPLLIVSGIISLYFQGGTFIYKLDISILPYTLNKYSYLLLPTWLFYFVFGIYFSSHKSKLLNIKSSYILFGWIVSFAILITDSKLTNTYMYSVKPTVILYSMISFYLLYQCFSNLKLESKAEQIHVLSSMSYDFYLSHILILSLVTSYTKIIGFTSLYNGFLGMVLLFIVTAIATYYFCKLMVIVRTFINRNKTKKIRLSTPIEKEQLKVS